MVTCRDLLGFLIWFEIYSTDSSKMIGKFPKSWNSTGYCSNSTGLAVTSGWFSPFTSWRHLSTFLGLFFINYSAWSSWRYDLWIFLYEWWFWWDLRIVLEPSFLKWMRLWISPCFSYPAQHRHVRPGCDTGDKGGDIMIGKCESQTNAVVERNSIIEQVFFVYPNYANAI